MAFQPRYQGRTFIADTATFDMGLRRHMIAVYNMMMLGLVVSGLVAYAGSHNRALAQLIHMSDARIFVPFVPFIFLIVLQVGIRNMTTIAAQIVFLLFSASMGLSLSSIFLQYSGHSVAETFFVCASMFAGTSLYGYTTKANLASMGSILFMALIGLCIGSIVNLFLHSSAFDFLLTGAGVIIFAGLTAFDTQTIRDNYSQSFSVESNAKLAIQGALRLYLDFINMFVFLLRFFGNRRN